jgi:hypothetical protein
MQKEVAKQRMNETGHELEVSLISYTDEEFFPAGHTYLHILIGIRGFSYNEKGLKREANHSSLLVYYKE